MEAQNDSTPGYPLVKRAIYYACRLISSQKGPEFTGGNFQDIKKVYSIWVCTQPPEAKRGTIKGYKIDEDFIEGDAENDVPEEISNYDLIPVRMIYLPYADGKKGKGILRMLDGLLSPTTTEEEKLNVLKNEFGVAVTKQVRSEVRNMCDYSAMVENVGKTKGEEQKAKEIAEKMFKRGEDPAEIADIVGYAVDTVKKWLGIKTA